MSRESHPHRDTPCRYPGERYVPLPEGVKIPTYPLVRRVRGPRAEEGARRRAADRAAERIDRLQPDTEIRHCAIQGLLLGFGIGATVGLLAGSAIAIALAINGT